MIEVEPLRFFTIAEIATRLRVERHQVKWILMSRHIEPQAQLGDQRGYSEASVLAIQAAIEGIAARR